MSETLFARLGGQNAVNAAVDIFYRKMLTDDRVSHFFDDVDMEKQIQKQKGFLTKISYTKSFPVNELILIHWENNSH